MWPFSSKTQSRLKELEARVDEVTDSVEGKTVPDPHRATSWTMPVVLYADEQTLRQIAASKSLDIPSVRIELGQSTSDSLMASGELSASLFGVGGSASASTETAHTTDARFIVERDAGIVRVFELVIAALQRDRQLNVDFLDPAASAVPELELIRALRETDGRWRTNVVAPEEEAPGEPEPDGVEEETGEGVTGTMESASRVLQAMAYIAAQQEKAKEFQELPSNGELALIETTWSVVLDAARGNCLLPVSPISVPWLPPKVRSILSPLYVPFEPGQLSDHGQGRLIPGSTIEARVLGSATFEHYKPDQHVGEARVTPIAIIGDLASRGTATSI
jgi:hypothetical protein